MSLDDWCYFDAPSLLLLSDLCSRLPRGPCHLTFVNCIAGYSRSALKALKWLEILIIIVPENMTLLSLAR